MKFQKGNVRTAESLKKLNPLHSSLMYYGILKVIAYKNPYFFYYCLSYFFSISYCDLLIDSWDEKGQ